MDTLSRRWAAVVALVATALGLAGLLALAVASLPEGIAIAALAVVAARVTRDGVLRRGRERSLRVMAAGLLLGMTVVVMVLADPPLVVGTLASVAVVVVGAYAARTALRVRADLPAATRPRQPVVVFNARSGGGKAVRFRLADEARQRGITPIELKPGDDLEHLVRTAVAEGADAVAAAGGDGTQAIVAGIAAELGLPFACIPAGTRNHFALDLGVDRRDVVGALDAFVNGRERVVDLAEVNGRVFVNNVSLGLYAEAVQRDGYRDAKLRTILDTAPDLVSEHGVASSTLTWRDTSGSERSGAAVVLVSNDVYRLGRAIGSGTRPRLDAACLGIAVLTAPGQGAAGTRLWTQWSSAEFVVHAASPVPAGVDGEAVVLDPPLRFVTRPGVLRVHIASQHLGASPSAIQPGGFVATLKVLWQLALGQAPRAGGTDV